MARPIRILLVDDSGEVRQTMRTMLEMEEDFEIAGEAADGPAAVARALEERPDVVLMDVNLPGFDGLQATHRILEQVPVRVIMVSVENDREYFRKAMQAGARDFLVKPFSPERLGEAVRQVMRDERGRKAGLEPAAPRVITVATARPGSGGTLIAAQLAASLARRPDGREERVVLVEAAHGFPTLAACFDRRSLSGWTEAGSRPQPEQLEELLLDAGVPRLFLLPGTREGRPLVPDPTALAGVVETFRAKGDRVVVDAGSPFPVGLRELSAWSERLVFVTVPEIPGLQLTNHLLLQAGEEIAENLEIWLNRPSPGGIEAESVERALGRSLSAEVAWDPQALHRINLGRPFPEGPGSSPLAAAAQAALERWGLAAAREPKRVGAGALAGIFGRR